MDRCGLGPDGMADRAEACYGGGISQVNESWGVGGVPKGLLLKNREVLIDTGFECKRRHPNSYRNCTSPVQ